MGISKQENGTEIQGLIAGWTSVNCLCQYKINYGMSVYNSLRISGDSAGLSEVGRRAGSAPIFGSWKPHRAIMDCKRRSYQIRREPDPGNQRVNEVIWFRISHYL